MSSSPATQARAARRRRWLRDHGCNELLGELDAGRLPLAEAQRLARLSPAQQRRALAKREAPVRAQELAAAVIDRFMTEHDGAIDVEKLCTAIVEGLAAPRAG
jgi:hypothetical protein